MEKVNDLRSALSCLAKMNNQLIETDVEVDQRQSLLVSIVMLERVEQYNVQQKRDQP